MALSRQIFTAANTEEFAEALRTALDNTGLFDSVTRSALVVTCTKGEQDIFTFDGGQNNQFITFKNNAGETLNPTQWDINFAVSTPSMQSYASISTDGKFVYCILTNSYTDSRVATRAIPFCICGTKNGEIGFFHTKCYNSNNVLYPPNYKWISSSSAVATDGGDGGKAILLPITYDWGGIVPYPLTTLTTDGGMDELEGVYGVIAAPQLFTLARTAVGVTPPEITLNGKRYLTDGVLLIEIKG